MMSPNLRSVAMNLVVVVLVLIALPLLSARAQDKLQAWESFNFAKQVVKPAEIADLSLDDLKFVRGIIFGRHGRIFKDAEIKAYLEQQSWYRPSPEFQNSILNDTERQNLDLIRETEATKHDQVEPGDMRTFRNRALTAKNFGQHTGAEWTVLAAEVGAIHGQRFDGTPWLQAYFDDRYWYQPSDQYDPRQLNEIERKNLQLIVNASKKQRHVAISPGDMEFFENKVISEQLLHGLSLNELRLLRNEIYARHGRQFQGAWLQQYFFSQPWYTPDENFKDEELSGSDKQNVLTIVAYENKIHDDLSRKLITRSLLAGLFVEDASKMRQEIYARRGKVFKEAWFQKYFESFAWYKANPDFTDAQLSVVEKRNIVTIAAYEKRATSVASAIEG